MSARFGRNEIATKHFAEKRGDVADITWKVAVLVGLAQVVAGVFPGTSRSAAAIFMAMLAGTSRRSSAAEFVFLVGIPTMFAASGYAFLELVAIERCLQDTHTIHAKALQSLLTLNFQTFQKIIKLGSA